MTRLPHINDTLARLREHCAELFGPIAEPDPGFLRDFTPLEDPRPPFEVRMLDLAEYVSNWATCPRLSVGAVIISTEGYVVSTGYNGSPRGLPHCWDVGCLFDSSGRCKRAAHAEMNAINQAADRGVSIAGCSMYVTHQPCPECLVRLLNTRLDAVLYRHAYDHPTDIASRLDAMVRQSPVRICHWRGA